ncbi:MAG TPA: endolytic transglycosylase MltG, partial [Acidimicrobiia bacterium]
TYLYPGLPPTPISAPGRASLEAAAAPDDTPFFFYVLSDAEGHHAFAETLEEHNANVEQAREDGILP